MQPEFDIELYNERLNSLFTRFQSVQKVGFTGDAYKPGLDGMLRLDVVAVDICGELSPEKGATPEDLRVNCETNIELQEFILDYLKR